MKDYKLNKKYKVTLKLEVELNKVTDNFDGLNSTVFDCLKDRDLIKAAVKHLKEEIQGYHCEEEHSLFDYLHFNVTKVKGSVKDD